MMTKSRIVPVLLLLGAFAHAQDIVTLGMFGFQRVSIPPAGGVNLVGFNFSSNQPIYLEDVFGTNQLVQSAALPTLADNIYIWNGATYDIYFQKTNGLFYDGANPFGASVDVEIQPGAALFLQSPQSSSTTNVITLSGSVLLDASAAQGYAGLVTIANPYPSDLDLNSTNYDWSAASAGILPTLSDNVYIWNPAKAGGAGYDVFFLKTDGKWHEATGGFALGNAVIPAGGGAFYQAKGTFTNEVVRPFSIN